MIKPNQIVKIRRNNERFWVIVTAVNGNKLTGTVDNNLVLNDLKCGDKIEFKLSEIIEVYNAKNN